MTSTEGGQPGATSREGGRPGADQTQSGGGQAGDEGQPEVEVTIVTMVLEATDPDKLMWVLSKYVVLSRQQPGCRNIDLCISVTAPNRFVIIEKWDSPDSQRAHFDSHQMVEMAEAAKPLLAGPPVIDLLEGMSAHDLI